MDLAKAGNPCSVLFQFKDSATFDTFFYDQGLSLCIARQVNSSANTVWLALGPNMFNAGATIVGWDTTYIASQLASNKKVEPVTSYSSPFPLGGTATLQNNGYWATSPEGSPGAVTLKNERPISVAFAVVQEDSGSSTKPVIFTVPQMVGSVPYAAVPQPPLWVWASATNKAGDIGDFSSPGFANFDVEAGGPQVTVVISLTETNQWLFTQQ